MKETYYNYYLNMSKKSENYQSIELEKGKTIGDLVLEVAKLNALPDDKLEYDKSMYFEPVILEMVHEKIQIDFSEGKHIGYVLVPLTDIDKVDQSYCISIINSDLQIINEEINGQ